MKIIGKLLGLLLLAFCAFQVSAQEKTLEQYVAEAQALCPATITDGVIMTEINYDGKVYETVIEITPELLEGFQLSAEMQQTQAVEATKEQYKTDPFTKLLVDKGVTMVIRYVSGEGEFVIEMPAEDIREMATIEQYVAEAQALCPATIGEGVTMTEINYDGKVYETVIEITPELLEGFQLSAEMQQTQAVEATKEQYKTDPFTKLLVDKGVTMVIRYVSGEGEFVIEMPAEDLK